VAIGARGRDGAGGGGGWGSPSGCRVRLGGLRRGAAVPDRAWPAAGWRPRRIATTAAWWAHRRDIIAVRARREFRRLTTREVCPAEESNRHCRRTTGHMCRPRTPQEREDRDEGEIASTAASSTRRQSRTTRVRQAHPTHTVRKSWKDEVYLQIEESRTRTATP